MKCYKCGQDVDEEIINCPHCGTALRAIEKSSGIVHGILVMLMIVTGAAWLLSQCSSERDTPPKPAPNPEEEARFRRALSVVTHIKKSLRNPDSVVWEEIFSNDDGSVVCVTYRAQNGFGGLNKEHISYAQEKFSLETSRWNKYCAKKALNDMALVKYAIK